MCNKKITTINIRSVVGSYEHGNEPSDSIKDGELLSCAYYQLLKQDCSM
jgi:hypothetical protein